MVLVRSIPVGLLIRVSLIELAENGFSALMDHPEHREDALQELRLLQHAARGKTEAEQLELAGPALAWLAYELGVRAEKPAFPRVNYGWVQDSERSSFIQEVSDALEAELEADRTAA